MLKKLKAPLTAILLSSVAVVPAATISYVATTDAAFAKSDNAGGKGNSGNKGGGKGKGASKNKLKGGKSAGRGGSGGKVGLGLNKFINKLTGKDKSSNRSASNRLAEDVSMHPSNLGNMNGALNANENAILAHIRNGNTNGPVGLMAALAAADYNSEGDQELLDTNLAADYAALDEALGDYESYEEYRKAYIGTGTEDEPKNRHLFDQRIENAYNNIGQADLEEALGDYESYEEYREAYIGTGTEDEPKDPDEYDESIEEAYSNVGYNQGTADELEQAADDLADYDQALDDLVDYWNKGDADSENADALRQALADRVDEYEGVAETVESMNSEEAASTEECAEGEECEEDIAVVE